MAKKTIKIEDVKAKMNSFLLNSPDEDIQSRLNIGCILTSILMETGNYNGFRYLTKADMKLSNLGTSIGIDQYDENKLKPQEEWFNNTDNSRCHYF